MYIHIHTCMERIHSLACLVEKKRNGRSYHNFHEKNRVNELCSGRNLYTQKCERTEQGEVFPRILARMQVKYFEHFVREKFTIYVS